MTGMYDIRYSRGQLCNQETKPEIRGPELWHVHYYIHDDHRYTWDISDGKVLECRYESWRVGKRRNRWQWMCDAVVDDPLPEDMLS